MEINDFPKIPDEIIAGDKADMGSEEICDNASPVWWMPYTQTVGDGKIATRQEAHDIGGTAVSADENLTQCVKKYTAENIGSTEDELEELNCQIRPGKTYVQTQCVKKEDLLSINAYPVEFKVDNVAKKTNSANLALYSGEILFDDCIVLEDISKSTSVTVWGCLNKGIFFKYRNIADISGGIYNEKTYYSFTPNLKLEMVCDVSDSLTGLSETGKTVVIYTSPGTSLCRDGVRANTITEGSSKTNDPHFGRGKFTLTIPSSPWLTYSNIQKFVVTLSFTYEEKNSCPYHCRYCFIEYKAPNIVYLKNKYKTLPGWVNFKTEWNSASQIGIWHFAQPLSYTQPLTTTCDYAFAFLNDVYYIDLRIQKTQGQSIPQKDCLTQLGQCIFADCYDLKTVILPTKLTKIPVYCFWNCYNLTSIQQQFSMYNTQLLDLLINNDFGKLDEDGIRYTKIDSYQKIAPQTVNTIGSAAFYNCNSNIKLINLSNIETLDQRALEYFQVPLVVVSTKLKSIPHRCCFGNHALRTFGYLAHTINKSDTYECKVNIPNSVQSIESLAFANCFKQDMIWGSPYRIKYNSETKQYYLENEELGCFRVYLPQSVTTIEDSAFKFFYGDLNVLGYRSNTNTLDNVQFWYDLIVNNFDYTALDSKYLKNTPHRVYYGGSLNQFLNITFGYEWMDKFWTLLCVDDSEGYTVIDNVIVSEDSPSHTCTYDDLYTNSSYWKFQPVSVSTKIGPNTFSGCVSITKLTLNVSTPIGSAAFKDCMQLNTIKYQASGDISIICSEAFRNCLNLSPNNFNNATITHINSLGLYIIGGSTSEGYGYADTFTLWHIKQIGEDGIYITGQHRMCLDITVKLGNSLHFVFKNSLDFDSWNKSHRDNRQTIQSNVYFYNTTPLSDDIDKGLWYVRKFKDMSGVVNATDFTGILVHGLTDKTQIMNDRTGINYYIPTGCWDAYYSKGCFLYFVQGGNKNKF